MLQRLRFLTLYGLMLCCLMGTSAVAKPHHFELQMDEQIHAATASIAPIPNKKQASTSTSTSISKVPSIQTPVEQSFQLWWLLAVPCLLLLIALGWLLGSYVERRNQRPLKNSPRIMKKEDSLPASMDNKEPHLQTVQLSTPQTIKRTPHESAEPFDMLDVHKAYRCFLFSRYDKMFSILEQAFRYDPYDMMPYLMSMRILSESEDELLDLKRLLRTALFLLYSKKPETWKEVAQHGREWLPEWEDWSHDKMKKSA